MKYFFPSLFMLVLIALNGCSTTLYPQTPDRAKLIEEIIQKSVMVQTVANSNYKKKTEEEIIELSKFSTLERKQKITTPLSSDYWSNYENNLVLFTRDMNSTTEKALSEYKDEYSSELSRATDEELEILANSPDMESTKTYKKVMRRDGYMAIYYFQSLNRFELKAIHDHLARMSKLDSEYNVCSFYEDCWK
ncbi:hypothetical protein [Vreelandella sulfidaeris]|uniref:hypothetical protein n=1 Tax=Vreelandella sulfidaeris TaxID=115553 RepID=UPI0035EE8B1F